MSTTEVSLGGFPLISNASLGGKWRVLSMDGWYSRAYRRNRQGKSQQDGAWPSTGAAADVPITVRGQAVFSDPVAAKSAARQFVAVSSRGSMDLFVQDSLGGLTRVVECDSANASPVNELMFEWSLVLDATDPLAYGSPTFAQTSLASTAGGVGRAWPRVWPTDYGVPPGVTPGAVSLANDGTASYWPRLRIDGPVPNPTVTLVETGDWVHFDGTVAAGQWLDFDLANRRVLLNGQVSVRPKVSSSGAWLAVPPGGGSISWTADAADPAASLSVWGYQGAWT
jgi:hypothetical protein